MKRYEAYKDSGIEWIGEIPEGWSVIPMKRGLIINNGKDYKDVQSEDGFPVIGSGGRFAFASKYLYDGEAVLLGRKGTIDKPMYVNGKFWTVDTMFYATPLQNVVTKYMYYQALTIPFGKYSTNTALPSMTQSDLADNPMCFPTLEEQKIIAAYLDYKVGQIDKSISEIDSQIESLKAYRQSVISEAVTKGVDKNARMKDSGIDWIGEIPEGWAIQKIKNVLFPSKDGIKIGPFGSSLTGKIDTIGNYKVYGQWNIVGRDFSAGKNYVDSDTYNDLSAYHITAGDILVSMMGTVGKCAIIPDGVAKGLMDSHVVKVRLNKEKIIPEFFEYVYDKDNSNVVISQIQKYRRGSIMDGLNSSLIKEFVIPIPPIDEQKRIVAYLDTKVSLIDELISSFNAQHSDLNALKQAIISEAVTGKIDLRDWTPSVEQ